MAQPKSYVTFPRFFASTASTTSLLDAALIIAALGISGVFFAEAWTYVRSVSATPESC